MWGAFSLVQSEHSHSLEVLLEAACSSQMDAGIFITRCFPHHPGCQIAEPSQVDRLPARAVHFTCSL